MTTSPAFQSDWATLLQALWLKLNPKPITSVNQRVHDPVLFSFIPVLMVPAVLVVNEIAVLTASSEDSDCVPTPLVSGSPRPNPHAVSKALPVWANFLSQPSGPVWAALSHFVLESRRHDNLPVSRYSSPPRQWRDLLPELFWLYYTKCGLSFIVISIKSKISLSPSFQTQ